MTSKLEEFLECIICDTGAFIKCDRLDKIGKEIYTLTDVIGEIRDKVTREKLNVLPYEIKFREPKAESVLAVSRYAKKTGDFSSLSAVDIRVMALTYQLYTERGGKDIIASKPAKLIAKPSYLNENSKTDLAGFYNGTKGTPANIVATNKTSLISNDHSDSSKPVNTNEELKIESDSFECEKDKIKANVSEKLILQESDSSIDDVNTSGNEASSDTDDEGWITPSNIKQLNGSSDREETSLELPVKVACITTDFAMQNVLIQMGIPIVSVDGYLIRHLRSYALRCHSCLRITNDTSKQYCPSCGNKTLLKVTVNTDDKGNRQYFLVKNKRINTRGMKYPLPLPKGGRFSNNPILSEDQGTNRLQKPLSQRKKLNVFDPDYIARSSPFLINDVHSRAAKLQFQGAGHQKSRRKNPNEVVKKGKRKK
ncbi:RNA-binding protein NOB1 [Trichoplax sp. H2]|nr:RNA-binding protein NOB1 [Trichoplax sp. H2]|eukprot:RDD47122.1 RNA-binding protein NOB1 [Trichoplax sp. H2]